VTKLVVGGVVNGAGDVRIVLFPPRYALNVIVPNGIVDELIKKCM